MDRAAQELLFRDSVDHHMGIFLKTVHGFALGHADREDLLQEILLSVWEALPAYNGSCLLPTFLYRVSHNRALNWHRSRSRYRRKLDLFEQQPQLALGSTPAAATPAPEIDWLYMVLQKLPPLDRTLIMLHLDQLPHRDIADVTGLSETNVGVRLHRIKKWLSAQADTFDHER
jgi:RNA polymerase sigma-70 factor (ECF subfamily)